MHSQTTPSVLSALRPAGSLPPEGTLAALRALPFADFARTAANLLERLGYGEVRLMGPLYGRGRNAHGGFDLRAVQGGGLTRPTVLAQLKQYREPVPRCFVDELRGAMLRQGAQQGLLIATAGFAPSAVEAAQGGQHALPVRLLDGEELARLLIEHNVPLAEQAWSAFLYHGGTRAWKARRPAPSSQPARELPQGESPGRPGIAGIRRSVPAVPTMPASCNGSSGADVAVTVTVRGAGRNGSAVPCG